MLESQILPSDLRSQRRIHLAEEHAVLAQCRPDVVLVFPESVAPAPSEADAVDPREPHARPLRDEGRPRGRPWGSRSPAARPFRVSPAGRPRVAGAGFEPATFGL